MVESLMYIIPYIPGEHTIEIGKHRLGDSELEQRATISSLPVQVMSIRVLYRVLTVGPPLKIITAISIKNVF